MSYYQRRGRQSRSKNNLGLLFIGVAILAILSLYAFRAHLESKHVELDSETHCPVEGSPKYVAIVFDKTDSYNPIQKQFLKRFFTRFKTDIPTGTRIALFVINQKTKQQIQPEFVVCNPGTGEEASYWTANPTALRQQWQARFVQPLDDAIDEFMRPSVADNSPIFEMLQIVALSGYPTGTENADKLMIIVSDMLHHTPEWSHYKGEMDFNSLLEQPYYQKIRTDLHNTEIQILYLRREGAEKLQTKGHAYFWADYINSINGRVTLIEKIDG